MSFEFLPEPVSIRGTLVNALKKAAWLDAAVAFIGTDWADIIGSDILADLRRRPRVVCWLSSTNTNPFAVEQMISAGIKVRQRDSMHAKVYLCGGNFCRALVGSANLSGAALAYDDALGQIEAGVVVKTASRVREIQNWFNDLWADLKSVSPQDLDKAKLAWIAAHTNRQHHGKGDTGQSNRNKKSANVSELPPDWRPSRQLIVLANRVRKQDPASIAREFLPTIQRVAKTGSRKDLKRLIEHISTWTGHPGAYCPASMSEQAGFKMHSAPYSTDRDR